MKTPLLLALLLSFCTPLQAAVIKFSDSFNRSTATVCDLGRVDNSLGGAGLYYYAPIFPEGGTNALKPIGAFIADGKLQNPGRDFGGVQFTLAATPCVGLPLGGDIGQDLTIRMKLKVPADASGQLSYAGPYLRSRRARAGDGIIGGGVADPSGGFWVQLLSNGAIQVLRLDSNIVIARTGQPLSFDAAAFHDLQVSVSGDVLQLALDGFLQNFVEPAGCASAISLPNTGIGNQGAAGIAFGTNARGQIGGQQIDEVVVSDFSSLAALPLRRNPGLIVQATNTFRLVGNNVGASADLVVCDLVNLGTVLLDSIDSTWGASVRAEGYLTNVTGALLEIRTGTGGPRSISADVFNQGVFRSFADFSLTKTSGLFENKGVVEIYPNVSWSWDTSGKQIVNQMSGNIKLMDNVRVSASGGQLNLTGGSILVTSNATFTSVDLNYAGGQFTGAPPILLNSNLKIGSAAAPATLLIVGGAGLIQSDIPAGQTLWVQGNSTFAGAQLNSTNGFANRGSLRLESIDSTWGSSLEVKNGAFTNAGSMDIGLGSGGPRTISADMINEGSLAIKTSLALTRPAGQFQNKGTIDLAGGLSLSFDSGGKQVFNQTAGSFKLGTNTELQGSGGTFTISGGTVLASTNSAWRNVELNYTGGQISGSPQLSASRLQIGAGAGAATLLMFGAGNQIKSDLPAGQTLWIQGNNVGAGSVLVSTNGFANKGALLFESIDSTWASGLDVKSGTFTNSGAVTFGIGSGGPRTLSADVNNEGTLTAATNLELTKPAGVFQNKGRFDLKDGVNLSFETGGKQVFNQTAGVLTLAAGTHLNGAGGAFNISGGTVQTGTNSIWTSLDLNYTGGQISGAMPVLASSSLKIGTAASPATFLIVGAQNELRGDLPANQTLWLQGNSSFAASVLNSATGFANRGVFRLESIDSTWGAGLNVNGTLTNSGVINIESGSQGPRTVSANLLNEGAINVRADLQLLKAAGTFENKGTLEIGNRVQVAFETGGHQSFIQSAGTLTLGSESEISGSSGSFAISGGKVQAGAGSKWHDLILTYTGGAISGSAPILTSSKLRFAAAAGPATLIIQGGADQLDTDLTSGQTLWVQGNSTGAGAVLNVETGLANRGTLRLESIDSTWASSISAAGRGVFNNAAGGVIEVNQGSGGPRSIDAALQNEGVLRVNYDVSAANGLTNTGSVEINAGAKLDAAASYAQTAGQTVLNGGILRAAEPIQLAGGALTGAGTIEGSVASAASLAASGGDIAISGNLTQKVAGVIVARPKTDPLASDRIVVSGAAWIDGSFRLENNPDYIPSIHQRVVILAAKAIIGRFTNVVLPTLTNQLSWSLQYTPTAIYAEIVRAPGAVAFDQPGFDVRGQFQFSFSGNLNTQYAVETSTNLIQWLPLTNITMGAAPAIIVDAASTNSFRYRFYRAFSK